MFTLPPLAVWLTWLLCRELLHRDRAGTHGAADAPRPGGIASASEGREQRRHEAPPDAVERDPGSTAGVPRR